MSIKCFLFWHNFTKIENTYQSLSSDGISKQLICEYCHKKYVSEFAYGIDFNKIDKKLLSDYVKDRGHLVK